MRPSVVAVGLVLVAGVALRGHDVSRATAPAPPHPNDPSSVVTVAPVVKDTGRRVIASATTADHRCKVPGSANGEALMFEIDTGDPNFGDFPSSYIRKLGVNAASLKWDELDPGTRYGKVAHAVARELRIGDVVWLNEPITFFANWRYSFGDDETPLFGLAALKAQGVHVEFEGDSCRLTVARSSAPSQCGDYRLSKLRSDETLRLCKGECSGVPFCSRPTGRSANPLIESAR